MRARWEELHAGLVRSVEGRESVRSFEELRRRSPSLEAFARPREVAAFLTRKESGLAERDRILRGLVAEATQGTARRIALALLILGLWPGLDSIFRKRAPIFRRQGQDIELEIIDQFIAQVQRITLARVSALAATLVLNTERELVEARVRECARARKATAVVPDAIVAPDADESEAPPSLFGLPFGQSDAADVAGLRRWLQSVVGPDADLIVDGIIHRKSRLELAASLGISHAATRKRLERALGRARAAFLARARSRSHAAVTSASVGS